MTSGPGTGEEGAEIPLENRVLRARARGELSADEAFAAIYEEYARTVAAWLALRTEAVAVDDLAQDVWLVFYARFRRWEFGTETESEQARPVLSFLFRTCQFVARSYRRLASSRAGAPLDAAGERAIDEGGADGMLRRIEASRALSLARRLCPEEELEVLIAKLSGMTAREIARSLSITEAVVDHRYRNALSRLRKRMKAKDARGTEHG